MFEPTEMQRDLAAAVAAFCEGALQPTVEEDDDHERFRRELITAMGEQGFCGVATPEAYGGLGLGYVEYCTVLEEIAAVSGSYAVSVAVTGLPQQILLKFGTEAQKARWLPGLASGALLGAFALSEPGSGSDAASLRTVAERRGDTYVLTGTKYWITHGGEADVYVVMARTGGPGARGVSAFLVPGDAPGLSFGRKERKMGLRASPTVEVVLDGVVVPASDRLADEGEGFTIAMTALDSGRITIAATAVGLARASMEYAARYATERRQFDTAIIDFQGVGFLLADMACGIESSRLLVHKAAWLRDQGRPFSDIAAMAKVVATDTAMQVTTDAVQVLGGYGYCKDHPVERHMRDAKVMQIVEGTNQIQRLVIARHLKRRLATGP
ncbi:MAG: acyl-CoA dehydrogenase family protein [Alphaproteobacteria bacterium]|nr:acyl-CoA dehydrogenase family protein [Alphaproteobacteria bacterium]